MSAIAIPIILVFPRRGEIWTELELSLEVAIESTASNFTYGRIKQL